LSTSSAASMAAYGNYASQTALTFMLPAKTL